MNKFDQYAYLSRIATVRAGDKLVFTLLPLFLVIIADALSVNLLVIVVMGIFSINCNRIGIKRYLKLLFIPSTFLLIGTLTILIHRINGSDTHLLLVPLAGRSYGITRSSLILGVKLFTKSFAAVSCLYFFTLNTTMNSFFSYLRRNKFPVLFIELMELMYRFIFVIWAEAERIYTAQVSRLGYQNLRGSFRACAELSSSLFIRSFYRTDRITQALEARGFQGSLEGLLLEEQKSGLLRYAGMIFTVLLIVIAIWIG